jgi:hypothetical protein
MRECPVLASLLKNLPHLHVLLLSALMASSWGSGWERSVPIEIVIEKWTIYGFQCIDYWNIYVIDNI